MLLAGVLGAAVAWCGASTPWWMLAGAAAVATFGASGALIIAAAIGFALSLVIGARGASWPAARAVSAALTINVILRWELGGFHGSSALVTGLVASVIIVGGLSRRGRYVRHVAKRIVLVLSIGAGLALLGAVVAGAQGAGALRSGEQQLRQAASALRRGDLEMAGELLARSHVDLDRASEALSQPWMKPALAVPVLAQHVDALERLTVEAEALAETAAVAVGQVDIESLRVVSGVIDLNAIELLEEPLAQINAAMTRMVAVANTVSNPWLITPVGDRIDRLAGELGDIAAQTDSAVNAVEVAPHMLGRDGPRTYFVAFTTPAEARGLGGFMGSFAELHAENGRLTVVRTGTTRELLARGRTLEGPVDYLARYGRFGAGGQGEPVSVDFWSNFTMSPDFPSVAEVVSQLYPQSGGTEIDGVIAMDVSAISRFLRLTGPVEVASVGHRLNASNAVEFLLRGQYAEIEDDAARDRVLEDVTTAMLDRIFGGSLPGPRVLAETLGPSMAEGRLVIWSRDEADQELLADLGVSGALTSPDGDGLAVVSTNAGANKLDAYLHRSVTYEGVYDEATGELRTEATIRLLNEAPLDLPDDVGGNPFGLPSGTNRMYLSVYSPLAFTLAEIDGEATGMEAETELGWNVYSHYVDIPPGDEVVVRIGFAGSLQPGSDYRLLLRSQPLAYPDMVRVDIRSLEGLPISTSHQSRVGVTELTTT